MKMKAIAIFASVALAAPMAATAQDEAPAFDLSVSGHVARIVQHVDGPKEPAGSSIQHNDAGVSGSRFRVTGSTDLDNGLTAGVNLEYAAIAPSLRHAAVSFGGDFGSLNMGHTAPATNGSNDDLSASSLAVDMACSDAVKGDDFCTDYTTGRQGVIRYNTPSVGAASGAFAVGAGMWDAQMKVAGEMMGGATYAFRVSYADIGSKNKASMDAAVADALKDFRAARMAAYERSLLRLPSNPTAAQIKAAKEALPDESRMDARSNYSGDGYPAASKADLAASVKERMSYWLNDDFVKADRRYSEGPAYGHSIFSVAAAAKFQSVSVSTLWGKRSHDKPGKADVSGYGVKLGYDFGNSGVGLVYRRTDVGATEPTTWGFGVQHNMGMAEFFSGYYIADADDGTDDNKTFNIGTRVKFN